MQLLIFRIRKLNAPVDALPLDLFRVAAGLLALCWLLHQLWLAPDFTVPGGLIDHALVRRIYPFTAISLFAPGMGAPVFYAALALGLACAAGVIAGWRIKPCAAVLLAISSSLSRWNFLTMHIDDTTVHLFLFWLLLLPVGRTLTWTGRRKAAEWLDVRVPGLAPRCLMANVALAYLIAGALKLGSPMWRDGFALYASLRLPIAWFPDAVGPGDLWWLRPLCWAALAAELSLAFLLFAPRGSLPKKLGLLLQLALHLGITAALALPVANLGLASTSLLFFGPELTDALRRRFKRAPPAAGAAARVSRREWLAPVFLALLAVSTIRRVPLLENPSMASTSLLWLGGVYEDYSLFDWIDDKNWRGEPEVTLKPVSGPPRRVPVASLLPRTMRMSILEGYLFGDLEHGSLWIGVPMGSRAALRASLLRRMAGRLCRNAPLDGDGSLRVCATVRRIEPDNADLSRGTRLLLMDVACEAGAEDIRVYSKGPFWPPCPDPAWSYTPASAVESLAPNLLDSAP